MLAVPVPVGGNVGGGGGGPEADEVDSETGKGLIAPTSSGVGGVKGMFAVAGVGTGGSTALATERFPRPGGAATSLGTSALSEPGRTALSAGTGSSRF